MIEKHLKIALIALCALCLVMAGALIFREIDARRAPAILPVIIDPIAEETPLPTAEALSQTEAGKEVSPPISDLTPETTATTIPMQTATSPSSTPANITNSNNAANTTNATRVPSVAFGVLTVTTGGKSKTFEVIDDVSEKALKKHVGWLTGSAKPGDEGMCVLLGHRDTDFRILKDVGISDTLSFTNADGETFTYVVESAKIVEGDGALRFTATKGKTMALVTCFPFYYSGHAPNKYVVLSRILDNTTNPEE